MLTQARIHLIFGVFLGLVAGVLLTLLTWGHVSASAFGDLFVRVRTRTDIEVALDSSNVSRPYIDQLTSDVLSNYFFSKEDVLGMKLLENPWADCDAASIYLMIGESSVGRKSDFGAGIAHYRLCLDKSPERDRKDIAERLRRALDSLRGFEAASGPRAGSPTAGRQSGS